MKNIIFVPETMDLKMKRLALLLGALALLLGGTGCKPKVHEYWISSDMVTAYKAPSDNAPVIRDLYTFVPVEVVEKDSTGQWGRVRLNYLLFKKSAVYLTCVNTTSASGMSFSSTVMISLSSIT